jgi:hypothetical protein
MPSTCTASRLLTAATMGYVGASPFASAALSWTCAIAAASGAFLWHRWISHGESACALPPSDVERVDDPADAPVDHAASWRDERVS